MRLAFGSDGVVAEIGSWDFAITVTKETGHGTGAVHSQGLLEYCSTSVLLDDHKEIGMPSLFKDFDMVVDSD